MDTDDLSTPTYKGVIIEAERFHHDLALQFGVLASECKHDNDFLNKAEAMIKEWISDEDFDGITDDIFFGEYVDRDAFDACLKKLLFNIDGIRKIPINKRKIRKWE